MTNRRRLLWVDCTAALAAGVAVLALSPWLGGLYRLPRPLLIFIGVVNLIYGTYSLSLAVRPVRPMKLIKLLAMANTAWAPVCFALAVWYRETASLFGLAHLIGEGLFVGGLGILEWRWRELLRRA